MNKYLTSLVAVVCLGASATVAAQKTPKRAVTHKEARHKSANVRMPDDSRKLNSDLAKLESHSSRPIRRARRVPEKSVVLHTKSVQQDRRSNPPINFSYNGSKSGSATHKGAASRGSGKSATATPHLK